MSAAAQSKRPQTKAAPAPVPAPAPQTPAPVPAAQAETPAACERPSDAWAGDRVAMGVRLTAALIIGTLLLKDVIFAVLFRF